jgi:outer membrane autotransporter protein
MVRLGVGNVPGILPRCNASFSEQLQRMRRVSPKPYVSPRNELSRQRKSIFEELKSIQPDGNTVRSSQFVRDRHALLSASTSRHVDANKILRSKKMSNSRMKRCLAATICVSVVSLILLLLSGGNAAAGDTFTCPSAHPSCPASGVGDLIPVDPSGNVITVNEGIDGIIYGGQEWQDDERSSIGNILTVESLGGNTSPITVTGTIYGGNSWPYNGLSVSEATDNEVTIKYVDNDELNKPSGYSAVGGFAAVDDGIGNVLADRNKLTITDMTAWGKIEGGIASRNDESGSKGYSSGSSNEVEITGSEMYGSVMGGELLSFVKQGGNSDANSNRVTITSSLSYGEVQPNGTIGTYVQGALVDSPVAQNDELSAKGNSVTIDSTTFSLANIVGGQIIARIDENIDASGAKIDVSGNKVILADVSTKGNVYGGLSAQEITGDYIFGPVIDSVTDNKVYLEGVTVGISTEAGLVEETGGVYGGYIYHDPANQAKGNEVYFQGSDTTENTVSFVDAGGKIFIQGGDNTITGSTPGKMSRAWDIEITGGATEFQGTPVTVLAVYETLKISAGTVSFGNIDLGQSLVNAVAPKLEVTGGEMTVTGTLKISSDQSEPGTVKVTGGKLIFNGGALTTGDSYPTGIEAGVAGLIQFNNQANVMLDTLTINSGGKVEFNNSAAYFEQNKTIRVNNGGELVLNGSGTDLNYGVFNNLVELSVGAGPTGRPALSVDNGFELQTVDFFMENGSWVSVDGDSDAFASHEIRIGDGATLDIGEDSNFGGTATVDVGDSQINLNGDRATMTASNLSLATGSEVNVDGEDSKLGVDSDLSLAANSQVSITGEGSQLSVIGTADVSGEITISGDAFESATTSLVAQTLNINNGGSVILDGAESSSHNIAAVALNVNSGGRFETNGSNTILSSGLAVRNGGVFDVKAGATTVQNGAVTVEGDLNFTDPTSELITPTGLNVLTGGEVDLGTGTINAAGSSVNFGADTILTIAFIPTDNGEITASNINFGTNVTLNLTGDDADKKNKTILTGAIDGWNNVNVTGVNPLLFDVAPDGSGGIVVGYTGAGGAVEKIAAINSFRMTRNYANASALMGAIVGSAASNPAYDALADRLEAAVLAVNSAGPGLAEIGLKQLIGEYVLGVSEAVSDVALKTTGVVYGRLDVIRSSSTVTPPAAGGPDDLNRVWAGAFGTWARQNNRDDVYGYRYKNAGFALGYDRRVAALEGLVLGASLAFSSGELENNSGYSSVDIDTFGFGLYGSYTHRSGLFFDLSASYGRSDNESDVFLVTGGKKTGRFHVDTWQLAARVGYIIEAGSVSIVPSVGVRYLTFRQGAWTETVTGSTDPAISFGKRSEHLVEIPLQVKISGTFDVGSAQITPELRLGYTHAAKRPDNSVRIGYAGYPGQTVIHGIKSRRNSFQAGAGVKIATGGLLDVYANYDASFASGFYEHQGSLGIGLEF